MFINIWHDLKNDEEYIFEHAAIKTIEEAIAQYDQEDDLGCVYNYTLKIEGGEAEKIYLGEHMPAVEEDTNYIGGKNAVEENDEHKTLCAKFLNRCCVMCRKTTWNDVLNSLAPHDIEYYAEAHQKMCDAAYLGNIEESKKIAAFIQNWEVERWDIAENNMIAGDVK